MIAMTDNENQKSISVINGNYAKKYTTKNKLINMNRNEAVRQTTPRRTESVDIFHSETFIIIFFVQWQFTVKIHLADKHLYNSTFHLSRPKVSFH